MCAVNLQAESLCPPLKNCPGCFARSETGYCLFRTLVLLLSVCFDGFITGELHSMTVRTPGKVLLNPGSYTLLGEASQIQKSEI